MTAPAQNTVFSNVTHAEPLVVIVSRCEEGQAIFKAWVKAYNENVKTMPHADESWNKIFWSGFKEYAKHRVNCLQCTNFDFRITGHVTEVKE